MNLVRTEGSSTPRRRSRLTAAEAYARARATGSSSPSSTPTASCSTSAALDDTQVASVDVGIDKARTAAIFVRPEPRHRGPGERRPHRCAGAARRRGPHGRHPAGGRRRGGRRHRHERRDPRRGRGRIARRCGHGVLDTSTVPALTFDGARLAAEAAGAEATARGVAPVVAVVDAAGALVYLWRPDAAQVASVDVATDKARTAAIFRRPSKDFEDQASGGRASALHLHGAVPLQGGIPLVTTARSSAPSA